MMGKEDEYHWASLTNVGRNRFKQTAEGKKPYNKDYFGFYKSHVDGVENKGNYSDTRFNVIQTKHKIIGALFFVGLFLGGYFLYDFFTSSPIDPEVQGFEVADKSVPAYESSAVESVDVPVSYEQPLPVTEPKPVSIDYLHDQSQKYQVRLTGIIDRLDGESGQSAFEFIIEFLDGSYRVKERMMRPDVVALGWSIERHDYGLLLYKDGHEIIARPWPLDNFGKVPQRTIESLKI